jgi:NDP-sugar pyrophosphorylase family protein
MQCVILAGGLATRLWPITKTIPKSLLEAAGKPFLHYQLAYLKRHGIQDVLLCVGYLGGQIREFAGTGVDWGLTITYADEGDELRGTGGALRKAMEEGLLQDYFLLTYGDSFLPVDFRKIWKEGFDAVNRGDEGLMTVFKNAQKWDASNAAVSGGRVYYDKKKADPARKYEYIDYGLLGLPRSFIENRVPPDVKFDLADSLHHASAAGKIAALEVTQRFYEVGSMDGMKDFEEFLARNPGF